MREVLLRLCQWVAAAIIGFAGTTKFVGTADNVFIFTALGMEPFGRYLIGAIELLAAVMLLSRSFPALGALLTIGTMCGAVIAHVTYLGFGVQGDGGLHILLLVTVWATAGPVLIARRATLPLIGETLQ